MLSHSDLSRMRKAPAIQKPAKAKAGWLSAEQGHSGAQHILGLMYGNGLGVIQDNIYSHMWINIAASNGNKNAVKNRDIVAERMTAADISKAQSLTRACVEKKFKGC